MILSVVSFTLYSAINKKLWELNININRSDLVFLDVEASSLCNLSYPISVGWCSLDNQEDYFEIKPFYDWTVWSDESAKVHGINRDNIIKNGLNGWDACMRLNSQLNGCFVFTDAEPMDKMWLNRLFERSNIEMQFEIFDIRNLDALSTSNWKEVFSAIRVNKNHNALDDAHALKNAIQKYL